MDRISELLHSSESYLHEGETLIYYSDGKMIIRTDTEHELVQVEGDLDHRIPALVNELLEND